MSAGVTTSKKKYIRDSIIAERLGVSRTTIWRWAKKTDFPKPIKLSPGVTVWDEASVDAWIASREVA